MTDEDRSLGTEEWNWSGYYVPAEGVRLSDDGYYNCAECSTRLEPTGRIDREGAIPRSEWQCPDCASQYWISSRGPQPKPDLTAADLDPNIERTRGPGGSGPDGDARGEVNDGC